MSKKTMPAIIVNRRQDGTLSVIDGQHRAAAAKQLGWETLTCIVVEGLSVQEEALACYHLNRATSYTGWTEEELEKTIRAAYPTWTSMSDQERAAAVRLENAPYSVRSLVEHVTDELTNH